MYRQTGRESQEQNPDAGAEEPAVTAEKSENVGGPGRALSGVGSRLFL